MTFEKTRIAITKAFTAGFTGPASFPVEIQGQKFTQPDGKIYGHFSVNQGSRNHVALGNCRVRNVGVATLMIFSPPQTGTASAEKAADLMASIFDDVTLNPEPGHYITFQLVEFYPAGARNGYEQHNASVTFKVDKTP